MSKNPPPVPPKLWAPPSYLKASAGELEFWTNGCGSAQAKFDFVPDTIWGLSITEACKVHDWMYHVGRTHADKAMADLVFLNNLIRIINAQSKSKVLRHWRRKRALIYYEMVCDFGGPAYWDPKNELVAKAAK